MKRPLVAVLGILASGDGFVTSGSTSCAATAADRTKVAEILTRKDAWRWAAANVVAPALLASTVLLGDMTMAYAADGTNLATSPTENYLPRRLYPGSYQNYCGILPMKRMKTLCHYIKK